MPVPDPRPTRAVDQPAPVSDNGQAAKAVPASPDVPVVYEDGADVQTTITHKVDGVIRSKPATAPPRLSPEQVAEIARRQSREIGRRCTELHEWLDYWREFQEAFGADSESVDVSRFKMVVTRLADDIPLPNQPAPFANLCTEDRPLGEWNFTTNLNNFIGYLQTLNKNSGGRFRVTLKDGDGDYIRKSWYDSRNNPIEGQQNATWTGSIPDPQVSQGQKPERERTEKKDEDIFAQLEKLATYQDRLKKVLGIKEETPNSNSLLDSVNASAAAKVVETMGDAITGVAEAANKFKGADDKDRGFFATLAHGVASSDRMQDRVMDGIDNTVGLLSGFAADFLAGRQARLQQKLELEKLQYLQQHPELIPLAQANEAAKKEQAKEDIYDVIMRKCEARERVDFNTDADIQSVSNAERILIRGALLSLTPEQALDRFIALCEAKGKGERARALTPLPQTLQFIEYMKRSVQPKPATEQTET